MRNCLGCATAPAKGHDLPSPTFESTGSEKSDISCFSVMMSVCSLGRRKAWHFVGQRNQVDGAIVERDIPICVLPRNGVLQPVCVIPMLIVLSRMRSARFCARACRMRDNDRLLDEVRELQGRH